MPTQIDLAEQGIISPEMKTSAAFDHVEPEIILQGLKNGTIVVPKNKNRSFPHVRAVGLGLHTKVNANIGSSPDQIDPEEELEKMRAAVAAGTDSVMDLSLGQELNRIRRAVLKECPVMVGTVPLYQVGWELSHQKRDVMDMNHQDILDVIRKQAEEGVDFMTIHAGVTRKAVDHLFKQGRLLNVVSRGGSLITAWMRKNKKENPFYEYFDDILKILKENDVTVSLGDGLRPGAVQDATDRGQISELIELGHLTDRCRKEKVQVMVEGPGHVPLDQIQENVKLQKTICKNAPFYVLGPLPVDFAPGYDHIAGAIGGALAAWHGADFLCYVTPAEHLKLPNRQEVFDGVMASRVAAYCADLARGFPDIRERTNEMSLARKALDWDRQCELALDPDLARKKRAEGNSKEDEFCSMCGEFCAILQVNRSLKDNGKSG